MVAEQYGSVFDGDEQWRALVVASGDRFAWAPDSTYIREPPFFVDLPVKPGALTDISGARVLVSLGDSVTTDHISPAGSIKKVRPPATWSSMGSSSPTGTPSAPGAAITK
jgi:aconitate hydratase